MSTIRDISGCHIYPSVYAIEATLMMIPGSSINMQSKKHVREREREKEERAIGYLSSDNKLPSFSLASLMLAMMWAAISLHTLKVPTRLILTTSSKMFNG